MKICRDCKQELPLEAFNRKGMCGRQSYCKACLKPRYRAWYNQPANRRKTIDTNNKRRDRYREQGNASWVNRILIMMLRNRKLPIPPLEERLVLANKLANDLLTSSTCPFTGIKMIPGKNIHLDHIIPISRRPDLALDYDNLRWTSDVYNKAKNNLTDVEFLDLCKLVVKNSMKLNNRTAASNKSRNR